MLVFDLETNGLLNDATQIHCIAIYDTKTDQTFIYNDECPGQGMQTALLVTILLGLTYQLSGASFLGSLHLIIALILYCSLGYITQI